jgi:hypothetical protein
VLTSRLNIMTNSTFEVGVVLRAICPTQPGLDG